MDDTKLIRVSTELWDHFTARTEDGDRVTTEWGAPDADGIYTPTLTRHHDDNLADRATPKQLWVGRVK